MIYKLSDYFKLLDENGLISEYSLKKAPEILNVSYNSKEVTKNTLFICKGAHFLEEYLKSAIDLGAVCYVAEEKHPEASDYILVNDLRKAMALLATMFYENVWQKIKSCGITGTKG